jgi:hypothetical protein
MGCDHKPTSERERRIAVIAVHGVGDQQPLETARRVGDLLQEMDRHAPTPKSQPLDCPEPLAISPVYYPFHEVALRINVNPVLVRPPERQPVSAAMRGPFHSWITERMKNPQPPTSDELAHEFMKGQLRCYGGDDPEDTYQTVRLEGSRSESGSEQKRAIHIYEVYWADLSRLKAGFLSIFTELYQLLFHLSSLGTHTVDAAAVHYPDSRAWKWFRRLQSSTGVVLTVPIPILNLFILGAVCVLVGLDLWTHSSPQLQAYSVAGVAVALAVYGWGAGLWLWLKNRAHSVQFTPWILPIIVFFLAAGYCIYDIWHAQQWQDHSALAIAESIILSAVTAALLYLLIDAYDQRRPGAKKWTLWIAVANVAVTGLSCVLRPSTPFAMEALWIRVFEVLYWEVIIAWFIFWLFLVANHFAGLWAIRSTNSDTAGSGTPQDRVDHALRSRWTGRLTLTLPAVLFLAVTLTTWGVIAVLLWRCMPHQQYAPLVPLKGVNDFHLLVQKILNWHIKTILPAILLSMGLAAVPAIWSLAPVVWKEVRPPEPRDALNDKRGRDVSHAIGVWLTNALRGLRLSGEINYLFLILGAPLITGLAFYTAITSDNAPLGVLEGLGVIGGSLFAGLMLIRGKVQKIVLGFRPILNVMLDVDDWLREYPIGRNPKARICGRYVSLLRYVLNWQDTDGHGYDAIVIVAHSQGTVITADLLRFLHFEASGGRANNLVAHPNFSEYDAQLGPLSTKDIYFFSVGCPLRQLYSLRFPYLYGWARHNSDREMASWEQWDLSHNPAPHPKSLGVKLWVNAYRSGDYVGRQLWRSDCCGYLWRGDCYGSAVANPVKQNSTDKRERLEFCIGAGAHTHYFDHTAPMVSSELDRLISMA